MTEEAPFEGLLADGPPQGTCECRPRELGQAVCAAHETHVVDAIAVAV
ncbi:MAG: hypothetical protein JNN03_18925 [Rubrivivax sp.]|nr:hypothetical protein [Rubrivivax sp.]